MQKAVLVKGLFAAVTFDGTIRVGEADLMRLVGAVLDCPLPPLLDSLDPVHSYFFFLLGERTAIRAGFERD